MCLKTNINEYLYVDYIASHKHIEKRKFGKKKRK